jgi:hypothetical protein
VAFVTFLFKARLSGLAVFFYVSLSQVPVAAHDPRYTYFIVTSPANGTHDVAGDGAQHGETPGCGQKDTDVRDQQEQQCHKDEDRVSKAAFSEDQPWFP